MATFISTLRFTQQGVQNINDTGKRANAFKATAKKMKIKVKEILDARSLRRCHHL